MSKKIAALLTLATLSISAEKFSPMVKKDVTKFTPKTRSIEKSFSQNGSLESIVPQKMAAGQNGYLIATSNYVRDNSKVLKDFIAHKEALGFKVHVATEDQFGLSEKGNGKGRHQADQVRAWMQSIYKDWNLLYTLIIADPHPEESIIPMAKFKPRKYKVYTPEQKKFYPKYLKYKDNPRTEDGKYLLFDGDDPSDYYYADLDSNWDANGNSILAEKADYAIGGINCVADVWVGRIGYWGEDHPYGAIKDVDAMLQRTMDYENYTGDQSWRKNMFYVGGADTRFSKITTYFTEQNGAKIDTLRVSTGSGYEPLHNNWHGGKVAEVLNEDKPYGFINFQEHGSATGMAGQINSKSAMELKRSKFGYVYLGGCDVNSPEHSDNITYTLFRYIGVGALGATRSVTGLGGDKDTDGVAGYARLYYGQSQGEAHWRMLSDYADGMKKVGASNFLMNLWGDPSLVIMPKTEISPIILSPNMRVLKFRHQFMSKKASGYNFVLQNTTDEEQTYSVAYGAELNAGETSFKLAANEVKNLPIFFKNADQVPVGNLTSQFSVTAGDKTVTRNLELEVYGRNVLLNQSFNTPDQRKIIAYGAKGDKLAELRELDAKNEADTFVRMYKGARADLAKTKVVTGENNCTIATKIMLDKKPKPSAELRFMEFGKTHNNFMLKTIEGKLICTYTTLAATEGAEPTTATIEAELPEVGKWHQIIAIADRDEQLMTLMVNDQKYTTKFTTKPGEGMQFQRMRFGYSKNKQTVFIDELSVYDYALNEKEIAQVVSGKVLQQTFPRNGDKANPNGANLSWAYPSSDKEVKFVVTLADNATFKNAKVIETQDKATLVQGLKDKSTYYWKVGIVENGEVVYPWTVFNTFTTDSELKDYKINIGTKKLRKAKVGDNTYRDKLKKIARLDTEGLEKKEAKSIELIFSKISGADWLRCHPDGSLTTNHGAPEAGDYEFEFSVSTRYGKPIIFKTTVIAE